MVTTVIFDLDEIVYTEELGEVWKPSLRGFEKLLEMLAARPEQAAYAADNERKVFIAPNRPGLLTVRLRRSRGHYRQPSPAPDAAPRVRIDRMGDLALVWAARATGSGIAGKDERK